MARKHKFSHTKIELHGDGSATIHHMHESDPAKNVDHAVPDLDGIHDSLEQHLNPEEIEADVEKKGKDPEALEEQIHPGIHEAVMRLANKE